MTYQENRERLSEIKGEAKALISMVTDDTPDEKAKELEARHDELMAEYDRLAGDEPDPRRPDHDLTMGGEPADYGWRDKKGEPVKVLRPDQPMAEQGAVSEIGFGDTLRALAIGARNDTEKRALSEGTDSAGGFTVPEPLAGEFIDKMRAQSVAIQAGARTVVMESKTLDIARLATDPTFSFRAENATISDNSPTLEQLKFTAESALSLVLVSRELLEDSVNINEVLVNAFSKAAALEVDRVALTGSGTSNEPEGILNVTGINTVASGGTLASHDKTLDAIYELELDNVPLPYNMAAHPRTWRTIRKLKDGNQLPLIAPAVVSDMKNFASTQFSITENTNKSSSIVGHWPHLFIGMRSELRVEVLKERYADKFQYGFLAAIRLDVQLAHPESFCSITGIAA
jgi:HK97 family phage major capsid protein